MNQRHLIPPAPDCSKCENRSCCCGCPPSCKHNAALVAYKKRGLMDVLSRLQEIDTLCEEEKRLSKEIENTRNQREHALQGLLGVIDHDIDIVL